MKVTIHTHQMDWAMGYSIKLNIEGFEPWLELVPLQQINSREECRDMVNKLISAFKNIEIGSDM